MFFNSLLLKNKQYRTSDHYVEFIHLLLASSLSLKNIVPHYVHLYAPEYIAFAKRFQDNNNMSLNENKNKRS